MKCFSNLDKSGVFENRVLHCKHVYSGKKKIPVWLSVVKKKDRKNFFYLKTQENTGYEEGLVSQTMHCKPCAKGRVYLLQT